MQTSLPLSAQPAAVSQPGEQHSVAQSIFLHFAPGVVILAAYLLLAPPLLKLAIPNLMAFSLIALVVLVPLELGSLYWLGKQKTGRFTLQGIVLYRERLPWWQLILLALVVLIWSGLTFTILSSKIDPLLQKSLFGWLPAWFPLSSDFSAYPRSTTLLTLWIALVSTCWIGPAVEEFYFRGYLLPRLSRFGNWAPIINGVLFCLYHFWSPWQTVTRIVAIIPLAWIIQKKRNIYIGIIAHLLLNTIGLLPAMFVVK